MLLYLTILLIHHNEEISNEFINFKNNYIMLNNFILMKVLLYDFLLHDLLEGKYF